MTENEKEVVVNNPEEEVAQDTPSNDPYANTCTACEG